MFVRKIDTFFRKKPKIEFENQQNDLFVSSLNYNPTQENCLAIDIPCTLLAAESKQRNDSCDHFDYSSDIGCFIEKKTIKNSIKVNLLEKHWMSPVKYEFPFYVVTKYEKQTKKYVRRSHLDKLHWLVLSHKDQRLYCKYCALFSTSLDGEVQINTSLKRLIKQPLKTFDDLLGEKGSLLTHQ